MPTHEFANGDSIPMLGLGTWQSEPGEVGAAIGTALEIGYRHVDCAPIYLNEPEIGRALGAAFTRTDLRRDDVWITSKLWNNAHAPEHVRPAVQRTLADLGLAYLDLYLIHWPVLVRPDVEFPDSGADLVALDTIPLSETWGAMESLVDAGLVRHIGLSNCSAKKVKGVEAGARIPPEINQVELHPYLSQSDLLGSCADLGILLTGYSPLGSRGRPERLIEEGEPVLLEDPIVLDIASRLGGTAAQVVIAWAIQRGTSVIPKSVHPTRIAENFAAASIVLHDDDMAMLGALDRHRRYVSGEFWARDNSPYTVKSLWDE